MATSLFPESIVGRTNSIKGFRQCNITVPLHNDILDHIYIQEVEAKILSISTAISAKGAHLGAHLGVHLG
jgi:hypothetical protein